jgi:uncharacterized repeat protein (TIGR01451 family)/uncharacterized repeat protein (TIGR02543 family)
MKKMRFKKRRFFALLLAFVLCVGSVDVSAFAVEPDENVGAVADLGGEISPADESAQTAGDNETAEAIQTIGEGTAPGGTEEPKAGEEPEATEAPEVSEEPEATEASGVNEEPEASEEPKVSEAPEVPEEPKVSEAPEVPEEPKVSEAPEVPEEPKVSEVPEVPEEPKVSEASEVPEGPKVSEAPEVPEEPKVSEAPEVPEEPKVSEAPEATEKPEVSEAPEVPEEPKATEAPKSEEVPAEVKAFLDEVAKLPEPEDVTKENAEEISEQVNGVIGMAEALDDDFYLSEEVQEALNNTVYALMEAVLAAEEIDESVIFDKIPVGVGTTDSNVLESAFLTYEMWDADHTISAVTVSGNYADAYYVGEVLVDPDGKTATVDSGNLVFYTDYGIAVTTNWSENGGLPWVINYPDWLNVHLRADDGVLYVTFTAKANAKVGQTGTVKLEYAASWAVVTDNAFFGEDNGKVIGDIYYYVTVGDGTAEPIEKPDAPNKDNVTLPFVFIQCQDRGDQINHSAPANLFYDGETTIIPGEVIENTGRNSSFSKNAYPYECAVQLNGNFYLNLWNKNLSKKLGTHMLYEAPEDIKFYYSASEGKWKCPTSSLTQFESPDTGKTYGWLVKIKKGMTPDATYKVRTEYYINDVLVAGVDSADITDKVGTKIIGENLATLHPEWKNYTIDKVEKEFEYKSSNPTELVLDTSGAQTITLRYEISTFDNNNVTVDKTASKKTPAVGEEFTYTIKVTNKNSTALNNVTITDTLPDTLTYVSSSDGGVYSGNAEKKGGTVTWTVTVPANGSKSVNVKVKANTAGSIKNTATATWLDGSANDDETVTATEKKIPYTLKYNAKSGDSGIKSLPVPETKEGTAPGSVKFTVSSQIPTRQGYTFAGWEVEDKVLQGGDMFTMTASAAAVSVEQTLWATWKPEAPQIPGVDGKLRVKVVCDGTETGHKDKSEKLRLRTPEKNNSIVEYTTSEVIKSTKSGYEWQYTVTLYKSDFAERFEHNSKKDHKYASTTRDTVDVTFYYKDGAWDYANLKSLNEGVEITYEKNGDENYDCNYVVYHVVPETTPELEITKTVDKASVKKGNTLNYTITVKNNGSADAANVKVSDTLPKELGTNISNSVPNAYSSEVKDGRVTITWNLGTIKAGESKTVTFTATAVETGKIENHASVTSDEITVPVESDPVKTMIYNLIVTKTNGGFQNGAPGAGCTDADCKSEDDGSGKAHVHYTVTVKNDSGFDLYGLDILDDLTTTVKADNGEVNDGYVLSIENVKLDGIAATGMVTPVANGDATHSIVTKFDRSEVFANQKEVVLTYDFVIENTGDDVLSIGLKNKATGGTWTTNGQTTSPQKVRVRSAARNGGYDIEESAESGASMGGSEAGGTVKPASKIYTVTYKMNDGTDKTHATVTKKSAENSVEFTVGKEADGTDISSPNRTGYVFLGWAEREDATTGMTALSTVTLTKKNRSKILYAVWTPKKVSKTVQIVKAFYGPSKAEVEAIKDNFNLNYTYTLAGDTTTGTLFGKDAKFVSSVLFPDTDVVLAWDVEFEVIEDSDANTNYGTISFTEEGKEIEGWTWIGSESEGSSLNDRDELHAGTISMGLSNVYIKLPTLPTPEEVHDSRLRVEVTCTTNSESWQYAANDRTNDDNEWYTLGQIEGDAVNGYTCTLTLNNLNVWAGQLNTEDGPRHALNETRTNDDGILSTTLRWDAGNQKWVVADGQPETLKVFAEEMFTVTVNHLADNGHKFWGNNNPEYPLKEGEIYDHSIDETMTALKYPNKPEVKSPKSFSIGSNTYVLDPMAANTPENELTGTMGKENVVINLYYSLDVKGGDDPAKPYGGPDGIPDKYQVKVTFKIKNGAWNDETTTDVVKYLTKYKDVDGEQVMAADGEAVLGDIIPASGEKPDSGFIVGDWGNNEPTETTAITGDTTYTYTYKPAPGRVTITVNFVDEDGNVVGTETVVVDEGDDYDVSEEVEKIPEGYEPNGDPAGDPVTGIADTDKTVIVPVRQYIRYIVTYTDGVDGEEVFADQVTSNLVSGAATPAFVGTPVREGYTFAGWTPTVTATVTDNVTYTAQWTPEEPIPTPTPEEPAPTPTPEEPAPTPTPEEPAPTPEEPTPTPTPEEPAPTPTPEEPAPTPTPEEPAPTPTPEEPTPTPEEPAPTPEEPVPTPEEPAPTPEEPAPTPEEPAPTPEDSTSTPEEPAQESELVVIPPVAPVPAAVPAPVVPTQPATPTIPEEEEEPVTVIDDATLPLAEPEETAAPEEEVPAIVEIGDEELPLAAGNGRTWALVNFALMNLAVFETLMLLIGYFVNTRKDEEEKKEKLKKKGVMRLISLPIGIISIIAFCLTEDISLPTGFVDRWTLLMAIIAIVQTVVVGLSRKKEENEDGKMA